MRDLHATFAAWFGRLLFSTTVLFVSLTATPMLFGSVRFFDNENEWLAAVQQLESFDTTAANIAKSVEIVGNPSENADLGSTLTFPVVDTGLARGFKLDSVNVRPPLPRGLVFRDSGEGGLGGPRNISVGDIDGVGSNDPNRTLYENDDFEVTTFDGPPLTAFAFFLVGNEGGFEERLVVRSGATTLGETTSIPTNSAAGGANFLGVISTEPFDRVFFDEDTGPPDNDDIAIRDFRFAVFLAGDYNRNGTVDAADYVVWRETAGTMGAGAFSGADGNGDSNVDALDHDVWRLNFGRALPQAAGGVVFGSTVPEPATLLLVVLTGMGVLGSRCRGGRRFRARLARG